MSQAIISTHSVQKMFFYAILNTANKVYGIQFRFLNQASNPVGDVYPLYVTDKKALEKKIINAPKIPLDLQSTFLLSKKMFPSGFYLSSESEEYIFKPLIFNLQKKEQLNNPNAVLLVAFPKNLESSQKLRDLIRGYRIKDLNNEDFSQHNWEEVPLSIEGGVSDDDFLKEIKTESKTVLALSERLAMGKFYEDHQYELMEIVMEGLDNGRTVEDILFRLDETAKSMGSAKKPYDDHQLVIRSTRRILIGLVILIVLLIVIFVPF